MAGIGFVLRHLARQDNLLGIARSIAHSAVASAGPWLFTVFSLAAITAISLPLSSMHDIEDFRLIVIYSFAFTLVISSPILMVQTRYLADALYSRDLGGSIGLLLGSTIILLIFEFPVALAFYFFYAELPLVVRLEAVANFIALVVIWPVAVFLSALKDYRAISWAFAAGLGAAVLSTSYLATLGTRGVLAGFTVGLNLTSAILIGRVFAEYPFGAIKLFDFLPYFRRHKYVFFTGVASGIAIWIDKWIMWALAPESVRHANNLVTYPNYDSAMFLAYLTIVPSLAVFMIVVETGFFESYLKFFRDIQKKATLSRIESNHRALVTEIYRGSRTILLVQLPITILAIASAPAFFEILHINFLQLSIFRYGALGAGFQMYATFSIIILSYFNNIKAVLWLYVYFMASNGIFTWLVLYLGYSYYGLGFVLSCISTFVLSAYFMIKHASDLLYHTFITSNTSVD